MYTRRNKKGYDGTGTTTHALKHVLPKVLSRVYARYEKEPNRILEYWPELIGPQFAKLTQATHFFDATLTVRVTSPSLYHLLVHSEKLRLTHALQKKFPQSGLERIHFRLG